MFPNLILLYQRWVFLAPVFLLHLEGLELLKSGLTVKKPKQESHCISWLIVINLVLCHHGPCPIQQSAHIFPSLPFAADTSVEALLVVLHIPHQIQMGFSLPTLAYPCIPSEWSVLASTSCMPPFYDGVQWGSPCVSMQTSCHLCFFTDLNFLFSGFYCVKSSSLCSVVFCKYMHHWLATLCNITDSPKMGLVRAERTNISNSWLFNLLL